MGGRICPVYADKLTSLNQIKHVIEMNNSGIIWVIPKDNIQTTESIGQFWN